MSAFVPVERTHNATSGSPQKTATLEKRSGCKEILKDSARRVRTFHARPIRVYDGYDARSENSGLAVWLTADSECAIA